MKFHNGKDFTAEDVKYTFDRILDPATASRLRAQYAGIENVTIVDPFTVRFALKSTRRRLPELPGEQSGRRHRAQGRR